MVFVSLEPSCANQVLVLSLQSPSVPILNGSGVTSTIFPGTAETFSPLGSGQKASGADGSHGLTTHNFAKLPSMCNIMSFPSIHKLKRTKLFELHIFLPDELTNGASVALESHSNAPASEGHSK